MSEQGNKLRELADLKDEEEDIREELTDEVRMSWLYSINRQSRRYFKKLCSRI